MVNLSLASDKTCSTYLLCVVTDQSNVGTEVPVWTALRPSCENPQGNPTACGNFCQSMALETTSGCHTDLRRGS